MKRSEANIQDDIKRLRELAEKAIEILEVAAKHGCGLDDTVMPFADDASVLLKEWGIK